MTTILFLAVSISLDSLGIGASYGIRKIKISTLSLIIIVSMTLAVLTLTWLAGQIIMSIISVHHAAYISSFLLIGLGSIFIIQALCDKKKQSSTSLSTKSKKPVKSLLCVIKSPADSDMDNSGEIDVKEALYLGTALSIDAVAIGLVAASYELYLPIFLGATAIINFSLLRCGEFLGRKSSKLIPENKLKTASGIIIILMGLLKLL